MRKRLLRNAIFFRMSIWFCFVASVNSCKPRKPSDLFDAEAVNLQSTLSLLNHVEKISDLEPSKWEFQINNRAYNNKIWDVALKDGEPLDFFRAPYKEIVSCADSQDGKPCHAYDNAFTYVYKKNKKVGKPFAHIIPLRDGLSQPEMNKWIRPGDIVVYFHPDDRTGDFRTPNAMAWRTTHAAIVVGRNLDGKIHLGTIDTPTGYAQIFSGRDETPFHVFRFMPKDEKGNDLPEESANIYRDSIAKWAILGFDQFEFSGDYDRANSVLISEYRDFHNDPVYKILASKDQSTFQKQILDKKKLSLGSIADLYARAAIKGDIKKCMHEGEVGDCFPMMYCSWFVHTNISLAWLNPMVTGGSADAIFKKFDGLEFKFIKQSKEVSFNGSNKISDYLVQPLEKVIDHEQSPFMRFAVPELVAAATLRLVGEDDPNVLCKTRGLSVEACRILWSNNALQKSELLKSMGTNFASTFHSDSTRVPIGDGYPQALAETNAQIDEGIKRFSQIYLDLSDQVKTGKISVQNAFKKVKAEFITLRNRMEKKNGALQKRWIPAHYFAWLSENFDYLRPNFAKTKPMIAYVGTVVHEKYVSKGSVRNAVVEKPILASFETDADKDLDLKMYELMDFDGQKKQKPNGRGYQYFFECLVSEQEYCKGSFSKPDQLRRFNEYEVRALLVMANDWQANPKTPLELTLRNTFGLDPVLFRRLIASYWNDPGAIFRPNILQTPLGTRQLSDNVRNFRLLLSSPLTHLEKDQNKEKSTNGVPETPIRCKDADGVPVSGKPSCIAAIKVKQECNTGTQVSDCVNFDYILADKDSEFLGGWPEQNIQ